MIWNGIYDPEDWGAFGAFVIAPVGGVVFALLAAAARIGSLYVYSKITGNQFTALDRIPTTFASHADEGEDSSVKDNVPVEFIPVESDSDKNLQFRSWVYPFISIFV